MARTRLYREGVLSDQDFAVDDIAEHLADERTVIWLDLTDPTPADLDRVGAELGLHELAVEDATSVHERPKLDRYRNHLFITAYAVRFDEATGEVPVHRVSVFVTPRVLVTAHAADCGLDAVVRRWDDSTDLAKHGVGWLLHGLLDVIVDGHFEVVQALDQALEDLEDLLFEETPQGVRQVQRRSYQLRKSLAHLRKVVLPMREVVNGLIRPANDYVDEAMLPYYQDVYDHVLRVADWTESLRDFVATILEANLGVQGNRMNNIMKKVTSWAAIIAVPTAVTGFYGQNVPYPGYQNHAGLITGTVLMVTLSLGLYLTFKRKDWL